MLHEKRRLKPPPLEKCSGEIADFIETYFNAYNAARLRESCQLFAKMIDAGATIGVSLSGALTPAGLSSVLTPLMQNGFIDYISSTGANLYHDLHFDLGLPLYRGTADVATGAADVKLRKDGIIRVYDVLFPADVLYKTDEWVYRVMMAPEFRKRLSTSELHYLIGKYALETARQTEQGTGKALKPSILATAHQLELPVFSPSPGDSTIGLNFSAIYTAEPERGPHVDPAIDVAEMSAIVLDAKRAAEGLSGVLILGGGAPKNFLLQTEPQLQEILGVAEKGHDFFIQVTDARPDTGGLSGATPSEAVSWGKIDPEKLPDTVVAYVDSTIALPLLAAYVQARCKPRPPRRLYKRLPEMMDKLRREYRTTDLYKKYWG
ncbi:MAG TPA: deoxyhypusine synthase [Polyangia bacterium]|jgi:deoxyhypusine synthase